MALLAGLAVGAAQQDQPFAKKAADQEQAAALALSGAHEAINQKEYDTAITLLENFLFEHPGHAQALSTLAYTYALQHRYREAVDLYRQTLEVDPNLAEARLNLATLLLFQEEKPAEAAVEFQRVLKALPDSYEAHFYLAIALERQEQADQALLHYRRAAELNPDSREPLEAMLFVLFGREDWEQADEVLQELSRRAPDDTTFLKARAELLRRQDKPAKALEAYEKFLAASTTNPSVSPQEQARAHLESGRLARKLGQGEKAVEHFRAARSAGGDAYRKNSLTEEAETLAWLGRYQEALPLYEEIVAATPDNPDLLAGLGFVYLQTKQYAKAVPPLARTLQLDPKRVEIYNDLASALFLSDNLSAAIEALDRRATLAPETPGTLYLRAVSYDRMHQCLAAIDFYEKFLALNCDTQSDQYFNATARLRGLKKTCRQRRGE
jgi:tetratricopeptide (TPR) repeat protein